MCSTWYILPYNINSVKHAYVDILKYELFKKGKSYFLPKNNKIKIRYVPDQDVTQLLAKPTYDPTKLFKSALRTN